MTEISTTRARANQTVGGIQEPCNRSHCPRLKTALALSVRGRQFVAIRSAFAHYGGMLSADEVIQRLRRTSDQPISLLARWIVDRDVLSFPNGGQTLIPAFQLDAAITSPRGEISGTLRELLPCMDEFGALAWFIEPNEWLSGASPIDVLDARPAELCLAARASRFALLG